MIETLKAEIYSLLNDPRWRDSVDGDWLEDNLVNLLESY